MKYLAGLVLAVLGPFALAQEMAQDANSYYREGWAKFANGNYQEAIASLDKAIAMKGDHIAAILCRAKARHKLKDYEGALKDYEQAVKLMPDIKENLQPLVDAAKKKEDYKDEEEKPTPTHETVAEAIVVPELADKIRDLIKRWGSAEVKERDAASKELEKIGAPAVPFLKKALEEALKSGNKEVQKRAEELLNSKKRKAEEAFEEGMALYKKGEWDSAIEAFTKAIKLDPENVPAYYNRGYARAMKRDWDGVIQDNTKAIELDPQYARAYINRGNARDYKGDTVGAIEDFSKAIELDPKDARAYYNRGITRTKKHDWDGVIQDYTKAIELDPSLKGKLEPWIEKARKRQK